MPVFEADYDDFTLTLFNLNYGIDYEIEMINSQNDTQGDTQEDDIQNRIVSMIKRDARISTADMANQLGISISTVKRRIKTMPHISYVGRDYSGHWEIKE